MKRCELTSTKSPRAKLVRKLHLRRHRLKTGLFVLEGANLLESAANAGAGIRDVFCTQGFIVRHPALVERLEGSAWPVWVVGDELFDTLATTEHSQGLLAVAEFPAEAAEPRVAPELLVLALEGVGDPGNVGSALRAAHAAGAQVVLGPGCCDRFNAKAARASAGAVFVVPTLATEDLAGLLARLRGAGARVMAADARGARVSWEADFTGPTVLVVGNEARGVSAAVRAEADEAVAVPMPGGAESLNAAAAAAVLLYEAVRQRSRRGQSQGGDR